MKTSVFYYAILAVVGLEFGRADLKLAAADPTSINTPVKVDSLAELEASPQDKDYGPWAIKATAEALQIIEKNQLSTGDEFSRISKFVLVSDNLFLVNRVRYELLLSAAALGNIEAEKQLAVRWDDLMHSLGRPLRTDFEGLAQKQPELYRKDMASARVVAVLRAPEAARHSAENDVSNPEINSIVDADQADRRGWAKLSKDEMKSAGERDRQRNKRSQVFVSSGELNTAADFANAALVMQHSASFYGYQTAHELAVCALLLGDRGLGRWLVAATYDRMLGSVGHHQRFGTQYFSLGGPATLVRVDGDGICDAERKALGCPTLEQARNRNLTRTDEPAMKVSEFILPDGTIRDSKFGLGGKLPEGWTILRVHRWGNQQTTMLFSINGHADAVPSLYYKVYHKRKSAMPEDLAVFARNEIDKKQSSRRETVSNYTNRADSLKTFVLGQNAGFSWIADFTNTKGEKCAEYLIRLEAESADVLFFVTAPVSHIDRVQSAGDIFMSELKIPVRSE